MAPSHHEGSRASTPDHVNSEMPSEAGAPGEQLGRRPRVVILTSDFGGGTGNHLLQRLREPDSARVDVRILTEVRRTARIDPPVPVEHLRPFGPVDVYPIAQCRRFLELRKRLNELRPDVLHTFFFWPVLYGRLLKKIGVVDRLVENREDLGFNWGYQEYALLRLTRRLPDRVIAVAQAVKQQAVAKERLRPDHVTVIRNGIRAEPVKTRPGGELEALRRELGIGRDAPVVGMVANLNRPVKGARFLVDAVPAILDEAPETRFLVVGDGDLLPRLRRRAETRQIEDAIVFAGYRDDVDACYQTMDVAVLPSLSEGLSITLLEAMRHELPCVATNVGGNSEIVVDGVTGYLVPARDVDALSSRILELVERPELRQELGRAGRRRVTSEFDMTAVARRYSDVYESVISEHGPTSVGRRR